MKKYKFFRANSRLEIIESSNGYFDCITYLPSPFSLLDLKPKESFFSKNILKRMAGLRPGTILKITKLCGWSSRSGGPEYLVIRCIDDALPEYTNLLQKFEATEAEIKEVDDKIRSLAGALVDEKKKLNKLRVSLRERINAFDRSGEFNE